MTHRILIVEDEILVAMDLEAVLQDHGFDTLGIAPDTASAMRLVKGGADVAFVDINLRDGATGIGIGRRLAQDFGVHVIFTSANPRLLGDGVDGTLGYLPKPYRPDQVTAALRFVLADDDSPVMPVPPSSLTLFDQSVFAR